MRVLVACEYSGTVRDAFIKKGHDAFSCDLLPTERSGPHFQAPIEQVLNEYPNSWDLMIAHPPCTHLAVSGASSFKHKIKDGRQRDAINFFMYLVRQSQIPHIAIENPVGIISSIWRSATQIIQPYQFGEPETKTTCLWLKNLPLLKPTILLEDRGEFVTFKSRKRMSLRHCNSHSKGHERSQTYNGIARAMADQWSNLPTNLQSLQNVYR